MRREGMQVCARLFLCQSRQHRTLLPTSPNYDARLELMDQRARASSLHLRSSLKHCDRNIVFLATKRSSPGLVFHIERRTSEINLCTAVRDLWSKSLSMTGLQHGVPQTVAAGSIVVEVVAKTSAPASLRRVPLPSLSFLLFPYCCCDGSSAMLGSPRALKGF